MVTDEMMAGIVSLRPFVPSKDYAQSRAFYEALGFHAYPLGEKLTHFQLGQERGVFAFILQDYYVKEFAENFMMHLLVEDVEQWWAHINSLSLENRFAVTPPRAPKLEPWGLRVSYLTDPAGVLWHFASETQAGRPHGPEQ